MCSSNVLDPMAQDIPEQDIVMGELELPPQMDPKTKMAAACDASPPPLHRNPSPIPAETAHPSAPDIAQICAMLAGMEATLKANTNGMKEINETANETREEIKENAKQMKEETKGMREEMKEMRGEMQNMGAGLLDGLEIN